MSFLLDPFATHNHHDTDECNVVSFSDRPITEQIETFESLRDSHLKDAKLLGEHIEKLKKIKEHQDQIDELQSTGIDELYVNLSYGKEDGDVVETPKTTAKVKEETKTTIPTPVGGETIIIESDELTITPVNTKKTNMAKAMAEAKKK